MDTKQSKIDFRASRLSTGRVYPFLVASVLWSLLLWGCSSSTDPTVVPPPNPSEIGFIPSGQGQSLRLSETMVFSAYATPPADMRVKWYRGGSVVSEDTLFTFIPVGVGPDTLRVSAFVGAVRDTYYWVLDVKEDVSVIPPEVPNVTARPWNEPGDVQVSWTRVNGSTFPLVEYLVAVSFDGPVNETNWDQATLLGTYPLEGGNVGYSRVYTEADDGMRPGEEAWFAVRVRDDRQQLSRLTTSTRHEITWPWYLGGYVLDDIGRPLLGVIVNSDGPGYSTNTDGSGFFLFDQPFRNIDSIRVATTSPNWYDFIAGPISVDQDTTLVDVTLINFYGLGYDCLGGDFLRYLREMSRTTDVDGDPTHSILNRWDEYPISVYAGAFENSAGVDMQAACLAAVDFWNDEMQADLDGTGITQSDFFVATDDSIAADVVFLFEYRALNYGELSLLLPNGPDDKLGRVVPEKMQVWINTDPGLDLFAEVQGVALHELGHALGLLAHSDCPGTDYLMRVAGGAGAMVLPEPIHLDERRAVRAIRNIAQGSDMSNYGGARLNFRSIPGTFR